MSKYFEVKIKLTKDCNTPADIGCELNELVEYLMGGYCKEWPKKMRPVYADHSSEKANGAWGIKNVRPR